MGGGAISEVHTCRNRSEAEDERRAQDEQSLQQLDRNEKGKLTEILDAALLFLDAHALRNFPHRV